MSPWSSQAQIAINELQMRALPLKAEPPKGSLRDAVNPGAQTMNIRCKCTLLTQACVGIVAIACSNSTCPPGNTQICVGPGGCRGGQMCAADGEHWGPCDCSNPGDADSGYSGDAEADAEVPPLTGTIKLSAVTPVPVAPTAFGVNYWSWAKADNPNLDQTQSAVSALHVNIMRIGGANNDSNSPAFGVDQLELAVNYAKAIGADILWQIPLVADIDGIVPTADTAAAMVTLANVTNNYGIKLSWLPVTSSRIPL